jgi:hypothetical protein
MFVELKPEEKIIIILRRYWLIILIQLLKIMVLFILPFLAWLAIFTFLDTQNPLFISLFWLGSAFWWLIMWVLLFLVWIDYYLDIWIITNQRIIDVRQKRLFKREVAELTFLRIQDLTIKIRGVLRTFLNFGTLEIRTAGTFESAQENNIFILEDIHKPSEVQNILSQLHQDFLKKNEH